MKHILLVLACLRLSSVSNAEVQAHPSRWIYDPYARQLGAQHYPGGGAALHDEITAVASLPSGAVLAVGFTYGSLGEPHAGPSSAPDVFLARFDPVGNLEWVHQIGAVTGPTIPALNGTPWGGDATKFETPTDVAIAADGSIFVTGATVGSLAEPAAGATDIFLAKYDANGTLLWLRQLGALTASALVPAPGATQYADASWPDVGRSIAPHPDGGVYLGADTSSDLTEHCSSPWDFALLRYDSAGNVSWVRQISETSSPLIGYTPVDSDSLARVAIHPSGRVVLAGTHGSANAPQWIQCPVLMTFDAAGVPLQWVTTGSSSTSFNGMGIDAASGRILVGGGVRASTDTSAQIDAMAASYDANLNLQWMSVIDATVASSLGLHDVSQSEWVADMRLDPLGNPILAGITQGSLNEFHAGLNDIYTAKFRGSDGRVLWASQLGLATGALGFGTTGNDLLNANCLAIGPATTLVLGGFTSGNFAETQAGNLDALLLRLDRVGRLR